ncbi:hypothetical protein RND81_12G071100 [Saponaria officinalis]|uniref:MYND-type domain-containing protein n=1 Tax=Saponaria officinalis TaxID=3572 RepID=A0AAW1H7M0_SAPOF
MHIEDMDANGESIEELKGLRISSLDEEEEESKEEYMNEVDDDEDEVLVTLGFVQKPKNNRELLRQVFPSKAGGVPAWLDPESLPSGKSCFCDICGKPLQFLLQIYAPISEKDYAFHRTLFVFMCPYMTCLLRDQHEQWKREPEIPSRSVKVFRCQLSRTNAFYKYESPKYDGSDEPLGVGATLCAWCGTWKGNEKCSTCKTAHYCSKEHQVMHWRGGHKPECQKLRAIKSLKDNNIDGRSSLYEMPQVASKTLWPEFKIEEDYECDFSGSDTDEHSMSLVTTQATDKSSKSTFDCFEGDDEKISAAIFQERIARAPEQILRYSRDERAEPLWPTSSGRPSRSDIPKCSYCCGRMTFEFQILPQLLYFFGVKNEADSLDWATIVVHTCADSCEDSVSYKEEFAWVQLNS